MEFLFSISMHTTLSEIGLELQSDLINPTHLVPGLSLVGLETVQSATENCFGDKTFRGNQSLTLEMGSGVFFDPGQMKRHYRQNLSPCMYRSKSNLGVKKHPKTI